ncbi:gamma-type small acid-soluble spore protein [Virgibacillus indicus]|uniref:Gamma-type small acid-soluble spore protein n=1 Tax=Virgibacillus indicus TaxID=2024554 RepID=A0A265NHC0_9BACI|nr:gamma-type small acid-soluble spore protein [Virgibacillus indicus]OZU90646.1 gamma-type small acid-soluble spore protein [Virgibacillus indicus]
MKEENNNSGRYTAAGTDIESVKRKNAQSGMSYNEAKEFLAKKTGGHGTGIYSDTDAESVRLKNQQFGNDGDSGYE